MIYSVFNATQQWHKAMRERLAPFQCANPKNSYQGKIMKKILVSVTLAAAFNILATVPPVQAATAFVPQVQQCAPNAAANDQCVVMASAQRACFASTSLKQFTDCSQQKFDAAMAAMKSPTKAGQGPAQNGAVFVAPVPQACPGSPANAACLVNNIAFADCKASKTEAEFKSCVVQRIPGIRADFDKRAEEARLEAEHKRLAALLHANTELRNARTSLGTAKDILKEATEREAKASAAVKELSTPL